MSCPNCQALAPVPKLGDLKGLPQADSAATNDLKSRGASDTSGRQVSAVILGLLAMIGLLIAGYAAIRWVLIDAPINTEIHIAEIEEVYKDLEAARLIREFENMEERGLELPAMFDYQTRLLEKRSWGMTALIAGSLATIAAAVAFMLASTGRRTKS
ncbi:MAG: hypothetical protein WBD20_17005 [Pirellulaceae bacterium]